MRGKENSILNHFSGREGREKDEKSPDDSIFLWILPNVLCLIFWMFLQSFFLLSQDDDLYEKKNIQAHLLITASSCLLLVLVKGTVRLEDSILLF